MSISAPIGRVPGLTAAKTGSSQTARHSWIGFDFSSVDDPRRARTLLPLLVLVLITALGIAALRIDLIRVRYAMATATEAETSLIEEQRALIARKRQLHDPVALSIAARERGFKAPAQTFSLPDPSLRTDSPPSVATGPRESRRDARGEVSGQ